MQRFLFFASFAQPHILYIFSIIKIAFPFTARHVLKFIVLHIVFIVCLLSDVRLRLELLVKSRAERFDDEIAQKSRHYAGDRACEHHIRKIHTPAFADNQACHANLHEIVRHTADNRHSANAENAGFV